MRKHSLKNTIVKMIVRSIGGWSDGIRIAMREGFTSGIMLDYIYRNQPSGRNFIGKLLDKMYLEHEGWRMVRTRKENLCANLEKAIHLTLESRGGAHICDVAAGPALYITEVLEAFKDCDVSAEIRDIDGRWLDEARKRADARGLNLRHRVANALDARDFTFDATPDIFVASGFYDWFKDGETIKKSMHLVYEALPESGYFVFTNQSGHVALEMTNDVFKDFNNQPLDMEIWDTELVNSWAEDIGFTILDVRKDEKGCYSNVLAAKRRASGVSCR